MKEFLGGKDRLMIKQDLKIFSKLLKFLFYNSAYGSIGKDNGHLSEDVPFRSLTLCGPLEK